MKYGSHDKTWFYTLCEQSVVNTSKLKSGVFDQFLSVDNWRGFT